MANREEEEEDAQQNGRNRNENVSENNGFVNRKLFFIVLLFSIGYGVYVNMNKTIPETPQNDDLLKQLNEARKEIEIYKKDQMTLADMFSLQKIIARARASEPIVEFSTNDTLSPIFVDAIKRSINMSLYACNRNIPTSKFDPYKNCFRELAIDLHDELEKVSTHNTQYFVNAGRVHYSFLITTTRSQREEVYISLGDIVFQILKYDRVLVTHLEDDQQQTEADSDVEGSTDSNTKIEIEKEKEQSFEEEIIFVEESIVEVELKETETNQKQEEIVETEDKKKSETGETKKKE